VSPSVYESFQSVTHFLLAEFGSLSGLLACPFSPLMWKGIFVSKKGEGKGEGFGGGDVLHSEGISVYVNQRVTEVGAQALLALLSAYPAVWFPDCAPRTDAPVRQTAALRTPIREATLVQMVGGGGSETVN
jgi:hypothetical protein